MRIKVPSFPSFRLQDPYPIAWIVAFPVSNERNAAVVDSSMVQFMRCADSEAQVNNVSLSLSVFESVSAGRTNGLDTWLST